MSILYPICDTCSHNTHTVTYRYTVTHTQFVYLSHSLSLSLSLSNNSLSNDCLLLSFSSFFLTVTASKMT